MLIYILHCHHLNHYNINTLKHINCQSQRPHGLRCRSAAARLLRSWVQIPLRAWMFVCCECSVLSGRGLCDKLITHPEESYRLWCVVVCHLETSRIGASYIHDISSLRVNCAYDIFICTYSLKYRKLISRTLVR